MANGTVLRSRLRIASDYSCNGGTCHKTNEIRYIYDGMLVIQERDTNNLPIKTYTRGLDLSGSLQGAGGIGGLLALTDNTALPVTHYYYHADANGNVTTLINEQQAVMARYAYDPYGNAITAVGPAAGLNRYRFSSKEWQPNSGLYYYYYGYRFYEPILQRWLSWDPLGEFGSLNLYRFVGNNSINNFDPLGLRVYPACFIGPIQPGDWYYDQGGPYLLTPDQINAITDFWDKYNNPPPPPGFAVAGIPFGPGGFGIKSCKGTRFINGVNVVERRTRQVFGGTVDLKPNAV